jgi:hypothetical protein
MTTAITRKTTEAALLLPHVYTAASEDLARRLGRQARIVVDDPCEGQQHRRLPGLAGAPGCDHRPYEGQQLIRRPLDLQGAFVMIGPARGSNNMVTVDWQPAPAW